MVDYLEERYRVLSIQTVRQRFTWRGIAQSNLIAILPGTEGGPPVVMADHIDTACEEDTFARTGQRVTSPRADDNATATAALLGAAAALRDAHPRHDIWLVHLTGEEFDLQEFELHGIPGVLFNEDMDYSDRSSGNPHNHQSTDVASTLDLAFAAAVAKIAIETTLRLAND